MWQVLLLRLRQACIHPFLSQSKSEGAEAGSASDKQEASSNAQGEPSWHMQGLKISIYYHCDNLRVQGPRFRS